MKLIGQFDSPFARRVGIAMKFYELPFEHLRWSVFRDAELIAQYNPLRRVPTLVLDDGRVLTETFVCLDYLDDTLSANPSRTLLLPRTGTVRQEGLRLCALASGTADKAVSLVYEREVHDRQSPHWVARCTTQIRECLNLLESERARRSTAFVLGEWISHADIAITCAYTFVSATLPSLLTPGDCPTLQQHVARCESMNEFSSVYQPFDIPKD